MNINKKTQSLRLQIGRSNSQKNSSPTPSNNPIIQEELTVEEAESLSAPISISIGGGGPLVAKPGLNVQVPVTTTNTGDEQITTNFDVAGIAISWFNTQDIPKFAVLKPGERVTYKISINIPLNSKTGDKQTIEIHAIPRENPRMADSTSIEAEVGPKAWFEYTKGANNNPLSVGFNNVTVGDADAWYWDFGDGHTSTLKNPPIHTYQDSTRRKITLTVTSPYGTSTYSRDIWFSN